mgnify:CR=1 FL=1
MSENENKIHVYEEIIGPDAVAFYHALNRDPENVELQVARVWNDDKGIGIEILTNNSTVSLNLTDHGTYYTETFAKSGIQDIYYLQDEMTLHKISYDPATQEETMQTPGNADRYFALIEFTKEIAERGYQAASPYLNEGQHQSIDQVSKAIKKSFPNGMN